MNIEQLIQLRNFIDEFIEQEEIRKSKEIPTPLPYPEHSEQGEI